MEHLKKAHGDVLNEFRSCKLCDKNLLTFLEKHEDEHDLSKDSNSTTSLVRESYGSEGGGENSPVLNFDLKQILKK